MIIRTIKNHQFLELLAEELVYCKTPFDYVYDEIEHIEQMDIETKKLSTATKVWIKEAVINKDIEITIFPFEKADYEN